MNRATSPTGWVRNPDGSQGYTYIFDKENTMCYYNRMEVAQWIKSI